MAQDPFLAALAQQVTGYQSLAKLAQAQHEYVQNSCTEELLAVLARRQDVLDQIAELEQCVAPVKKRWGEFLAELGEHDRLQAEFYLTETRRLLEEITSADRNDALVLQQRKINLGREINQATAARMFNRNYAAAAYGQKAAALDIQR
ncbi:MAG: hypothetical protein M3O30_03965 [Planctomycetota bacterium]|nr:hypothetical protein [Planctomycetota bacterium]